MFSLDSLQCNGCTNELTLEKPFKCDICDQQFYQMTGSKVHKQTHIGEKAFKCNICYKKFSQKQNLSAHIRIHSGEKHFKRDLCSKSYKLWLHVCSNLIEIDQSLPA